MSEANELTSREWAIYNNDKEMWELSANHAKEMKLLDIQLQRLEAKWASWIKLPLVVITLPVRILFVIPLSIYAIRKQEVPEAFWNFLK